MEFNLCSIHTQKCIVHAIQITPAHTQRYSKRKWKSTGNVGMSVWDRLAGPKQPVEPIRRIQSTDDSSDPASNKDRRRPKGGKRRKPRAEGAIAATGVTAAAVTTLAVSSG